MSSTATNVHKVRVANLIRAIGDRTIAGFSRHYGFNSAYISQLLNGHRHFGEKAARAAELKIGLAPGSFDIDPANGQNNDDSIRPVGAVPLIPWEWAARWPQPGKLNDLTDDDYLRCPVATSNKAFALRVLDPSMQAPAGRTYPPGCVVFIEPEMRGPDRPTEAPIRVLVVIDKTPTLRELTNNGRGRKRVLLPLNPQYPMYDGPFTLVGFVLGAWIPG